MLLQFTVSNFRAFRGTQVLNLAASNYEKGLAENCVDADLPGASGQWLKGIALYGPNAGGKSTLIAAVGALANLVVESAKLTDPKQPLRVIQPFALATEAVKEPTAFGAVFVKGGVRYELRVAATAQRIWHESLRAFPKGKERLWYARDWNPEQNRYRWTPERPTGFRRDSKIEEYTLPNVLYLSKAISLGDTQLEPVFGWFRDNLRIVDLSARNGGLALKFTAQELLAHSPLAADILELLRQADLGIEAVNVRQEGVDPAHAAILERIRTLLPQNLHDNFRPVDMERVEFLHRAAEAAIPLPWEAESAGTQQLFEVAGPWLDTLRMGHTVCIDELETSMHPLMVHALLRLLFSRQTNPKGAQVIFTTHNPLLLDTTLLRRDQVWFADKDDHGEAHLYPLTDYAPRKGESLVRGYLSGRYGAVPFIPQGLLGNGSKNVEDADFESDE